MPENNVITPEPNLDDFKRIMTGPLGVRSLALTGLFVLAAFYTLYFARSFFLSITVALILNFLFSPVVRTLKRARIPQAVSALLVLIGLLLSIGAGMWGLSRPVAEWMEKAPALFRKAERELAVWKAPVQKVTEATQQVEKLTEIGSDAPRREVQIRKEGWTEGILTETVSVLFNFLLVLILLYFLLAAGDLFLRKVISILPSLADKRTAVQIAREVEQNVSIYLATVTTINAGLGLVTGLLMAWLGMPNPVLWGVLTAVANFIPYIGAIVVASVLFLVGLSTFGTLALALVPPACFLTLTSIEGYLLTPWILGRRLTLNPVVIFVSLMFWGWLWGIPGALLAVPIMATFKIICDRVEPLAPIGELLGA